MKQIAMVCALVALAACRQDAAAPAEEETATAEQGAPAAWGLEAGTYAYSRSDGVAGINTVAADGTYSNAVNSGEIETGTWAQEGELGCFAPAEGDKRCYTFTQPDASGSFTGTMADGTTVTVRKVG
ncbi:MAG TPA: hypothetical protein VEB68_00770 [Croceibacterium sp.]|nr:hypothetical protein [Propylenella sp.]HYD23299.1 hypothetical protein [Croceibacterium sp.]